MAVPGDLMSALLAAGEIPDPYYGKNELGLQWIGREDWRLERDFELDEAFLSHESVYLEALVLDTVAEIELNGQGLGSSRNMWRRFRADAKPLLRAGKNRLAITIRSPERAAAEAAAALAYPIPASEYPVFSPHRNLLRKAQCMAGWDWGPCLMTGGIYDGIALVAHDGPRLEYATTRMRREGAEWIVGIDLDLEAPVPSRCRATASLAGANASAGLDLPAGASRRSLELRVRDVEAWWPAGYGAQPLYDLRVELCPLGAPEAGKDGGRGHEGREAGAGRGHSLEKRLGFRELSVVAEEDEWGKSLKFAVNGREVFAKGANWIPADALPSRWTRERLADLLGSAVAANMNCLRVWGGGRYESEDFYGLCDELGLLVWQDCMFSCALYPSSPAFLAEVEAETRHQVLRLKDHPSIALWCGNNEALGAITWYEESRTSPARYIADYDRLTEGTVGRVVRNLDPGRAWWPSSPSAGPDDWSDNWHADGRGDMHYWTVWHEGKPFSAYLDVKPRFCSEFGFQSLPSARTVAAFAPEDERNVTSPVMEDHQRHPRGNALIMETMLRYFRMPSGFRETLYLSQVQQALAIRTAVEYWRSLRPRCMGTLYWQLNDVWPVASWSSLEYDGSWKLLHHEARRFYEPLHLALVRTETHLEAHAMNDLALRFSASLGLRLRRFDGSLVSEVLVDAVLEHDSSACLWRLPLSALPGAADALYLDASLSFEPFEADRVYPACAPTGISCQAEASSAAGGDSGVGLAGTAGGLAQGTRKARLFLTEPKRCALVDPHLSVRVEEGREGLAARVRAEAPAFWVALELEASAGDGPRGRFADSGFDLGPGEEAVVAFIPAEGAPRPTAAGLEAALRVMHLRASY
jgi:beta-mannosidase